MALGARRRDVIGIILRLIGVTIAAGIALGLASAVALVRSVEGLLFDYPDVFRRAAQYFFIRRLTALRAAADIFRRRRRPAPPPAAFRLRLRAAPPSSAVIA
jgi:hypothetical protein